MAASVTFTPYMRVTPSWLGSKIVDPKVVIPGGILIEAADFPTVADKDGKRFVEGGTFLGRTYAERDAGTGYGPADTATDEQYCLLLHDLADADMDNIAAGVQPNAGNIVYTNFLPGFDSLAAASQAKLRDLYLCLTGQA